MVSPMVASSGTENTFGLMIRPAVSSGYWSRSSTSEASRLRIPPEHPLAEFLGEFTQELGGVVGIEFLEELGDLGGLQPRHQVGGALDPELSERRRGEIQIPLEDDPERFQPVGLGQVGENLRHIRRMQLLEDAVCVSEGPPGHQFAHRLREQRGLGENHGGYRKGRTSTGTVLRLGSGGWADSSSCIRGRRVPTEPRPRRRVLAVARARTSAQGSLSVRGQTASTFAAMSRPIAASCDASSWPWISWKSWRSSVRMWP